MTGKKSQKFMVIDLFSGPGGLGEGFSAFRSTKDNAPFKIAMSVEFEPMAHKTLLLRAFYRQFTGKAPAAYYDYIRGEGITRDQLFDMYPKEAERAIEEVLEKPRELGPWADDEPYIFKRLRELNKQHTGPKVVIGGPPCQAYSTVGRARNKGNKNYKEAEDKRYFLYEEFSKVLAISKPDVFVLENVEGMLSAKLDEKPIFYDVLESLRYPKLPRRKTNNKNCQYRVYSIVTGGEITELDGDPKDCVVKMHEYGVPQARKRVILLGILASKAPEVLESVLTPATKTELNQSTVKNLIGELPRLRSRISRGKDSLDAWHKAVNTSGKLVARELKKQGLDSSMVMPALDKASNLRSFGGHFVKSRAGYKGPKHLAAWLPDDRIQGFLNHETRGHKASDLSRYLYYACFAGQNKGVSPHVYDLPDSLKPDHKNVIDDEEDGLKKERVFADRFKVQSANAPASTITSHIKKDGHYYIHYDPSQVRSLTVREAARLQTFPDNYFFEGGQGAQYQQVGNAVPPWLACQIAQLVSDLLNQAASS